ncbi:MAG TPA: FAD-binding oxidoreductase, partial [Rhizobiales bacterium]|nr:FAD-binding oxidoreductase [Hyphomicrobiales bacterium]
GADGDVSFCQQGYLSLASHEGKKVLAQNHATQTAAGADIIYMHPPELVARFPWIDFDGIAAGCFGASGEGWIDGWSLMNVLRREARKNGAVWLNDEVTGLEVTNNTVEAVRLAGGGKITCGHVVNAAGIAARDIAAMAGIDLPVVPAKRYVFAFDCRETTPAMTAGPLMVDPSGFYVRPEGTGFICGLSPKPGEEPEPCGFDVDYSWFEERIWPLMAARIPAFEAIKLTGAWTGYYAMNTFDQNAICGPHPEIANFYFANGFSGHGLQQTPGIGRAIAELIGYGSYRSLDLHRFGFERIAANSPAAEVHVI